MTKLSMIAMALLIFVGANTASYAQATMFEFAGCTEPDLSTRRCTNLCTDKGYSPDKKHAVAVDLTLCATGEMACHCEK